MRIKFISTKNKNPLIYFEQKQTKIQNPQKILSLKNMKKMHEKCK